MVSYICMNLIYNNYSYHFKIIHFQLSIKLGINTFCLVRFSCINI